MQPKQLLSKKQEIDLVTHNIYKNQMNKRDVGDCLLTWIINMKDVGGGVHRFIWV